ncbi:MAG: proline--tRNA ligase [Chloroflexi bacterium HGW-Chloroflexi-3]|nr:MAG: proline--tRNA ligase [Chloroflexi bacterium HGW-Chloroflexi-3]
MRMSQLFNQTLREFPADATTPGNQLLQRAGYVRQVATNIFFLNPLATRSLQKIKNMIRQELIRHNGQELSIPALLSGEMLTNRSDQSFLDVDMLDVSDSSNHQMYLASLAHHYLADLIQHSIRSHRQLPRLLFQIQPRTLNGRQNRAGLLSTRSVTRLETFLLDKDQSGATQQFQQLVQSFQNIFKQCNLPVSVVEFDYQQPKPQSGLDFVFLHLQGDTTLLHCESCGYRVNLAFASAVKQPFEPEPFESLKKVHTPNTKTIEDLAKFLEIPASRTAKAVFITATMIEKGEKIEKVVMAIVRGDMDLNESKLAKVINAYTIRSSSDLEIQSIGAIPGFASPVGLKDALIVVDDLIPNSPNLVAGANEKDYHFKHVNYGRDFQANIIADITEVETDAACPQCNQPLSEQSGFLVGKVTFPDTLLASETGCNFQDETGELKPIFIGSAWFDLERILAGVAEISNDDYGLIWPFSLTPYQVHLVVLPSKNTDQPQVVAESLYQELQRARIEVLYDDRKESPGVKFNDADLVGIPLRITVAEKSLSQGQVEFKIRHQKEKQTVPLEDVLPQTMHTLLQLERGIAQSLVK